MISSKLSSLSYIVVIGLAHGLLIPEGLLARIILARVEELFYIVNFRRVEHNKEIIIIINSVVLRKRIEEEVQK